MVLTVTVTTTVEAEAEDRTLALRALARHLDSKAAPSSTPSIQNRYAASGKRTRERVQLMLDEPHRNLHPPARTGGPANSHTRARVDGKGSSQ